ncbi:diguanylate cyclase (GGDEF)-like protein [Mycolicibacterium sp. BK556]|uniref:GGDEF domain-containing protein n=1 Tax=Mycobacteriaceae TaxID=1762 RepID=UPI00105CF81F|nr:MULTISPECIES: GGDEF domain-containing protein [Mycobacteriaceae]MBB3603900.1 diguanylate cyclase (GGDEF)-like protein [Mycolicibacterium sp. BK556]MBB3634095.1 diguanylate cyclase (GGDEF)-like protein [Mycolicibacterium sp. BK607]MBB3751676.1 diguanylate cyclase (GGDEF)-like protein [Mycolicibacterium sp. BK634]TDO12190.1 diguanylate cyclase (GGDEF)-like protein [Mycobacterium sp. BK086]
MRSAFSGRPANQYYTLTALLAARGAQTYTSRVIAGSVFTLGLISLSTIGSSAVLQWPASRLLLGGVAVLCFLSTFIWLRHRWPTRTESGVLVGIAAVAIPIGTIAPVVPMYGLLGSASFALIIGYAALFHGPRLLAAILTVAVATLIYLAIRMAKVDLPLALAGVALMLLLYVFAAFSCRLVVWLTGTEDGADSVEPLTGLLNRDAFYLQTATLLASRNRDDDRYLVIGVVNIDSFAAMVAVAGNRGGNRARIAAGQALRETVRRDAILGHVGEAEFFVADCFTTPDSSPLIERIRGAIAATPSGMTASIGVVSTPLRPLVEHPPHEILDEIVALATTAMYEARRAGGNQARYVVRPNLSINDDETDGYDTPLL